MAKKRKSKREKIASQRKKKQKSGTKTATPKPKTNPHSQQIKKDLLKTLALSVLAIGIVLVLYWG